MLACDRVLVECSEVRLVVRLVEDIFARYLLVPLLPLSHLVDDHLLVELERAFDVGVLVQQPEHVAELVQHSALVDCFQVHRRIWIRDAERIRADARPRKFVVSVEVHAHQRVGARVDERDRHAQRR